MKKMMSFVLTAIMIFALVGCSNNAVSEIEVNSWKMTTVQSVENDGQVIAYGSDDNSTLDSATKIDLECKAENGNLTLSDLTNNKTYTGTYLLKSSSSESTIYEVHIGDAEGLAVVSFTKYNDDTQKPTLILSMENFAVNFFALDK